MLRYCKLDTRYVYRFTHLLLLFDFGTNCKTLLSGTGLQREVGYNPVLAQKSDDGVFWLCWEDVLVYFQVSGTIDFQVFSV